MGEMLKATERAKPPAGPGRGKLGAGIAPTFNPDAPTLADIGISKHESARAQKMAALPEDKLNSLHFLLKRMYISITAIIHHNRKEGFNVTKRKQNRQWRNTAYRWIATGGRTTKQGHRSEAYTVFRRDGEAG
jgi:hypothetical protein